MSFEIQGEEVKTLNPYESFFTSRVPSLSIRYVEEESGNMIVSLSRSVESEDEDVASESKDIELTFGPRQREEAANFFIEAREKLEGYRDGDEERGVAEITAMFESKESELG